MPTIGVALAIPEPWATRLQDYRAALGDLTATSIPTHITLVGPTEVADCDDVRAHLSSAAEHARGFRVHLRGTGTFRPVSPVVFVSLAAGISGCEQLASVVRTGPLDVDPTFPYHPHVTVAHHLPDDRLDQAYAELSGFECEFDVTGFHLYVHDEVDGWRTIDAFPLQQDEPGRVPARG